MSKRFFIFIAFFCIFFLAVQKSHAQSKITSSASLTYTVQTSGTTHVTAHIDLTNETTNLYVSSYSLTLGFGSLSNIQASDPKGAIQPVVKQTAQGQEITLTFNDVVAGMGKTLPFTLSFDTPDIATHNGSIWEINIPGLANQNDFQNFSVVVVVPESFGTPTFIKPDTGSSSLTFTKTQLGKSGISITFGSKQTYAYTLQYHLQNNNVYPVATDIALPPTTNYQTVSLTSLSPTPQNVTLDTDGNWLAHYILSPSEKETITAQGLIAVALIPKQQTLSAADRSIYLQQQPYWQTNDPSIVALAKQLQTPEAIYNYVVTHLTYDFNRVKNGQVRVGAAGVLQNPTSAVCLEFTDLFIALSRAAGIPAREIDGFGYTQNTISRPLLQSEDVLHAWPEYYDDAKQMWIMVDPTWGNTTGGVDYFHTLDFDHVAFVIQGVSSTYPVPAGGYKFDNQPTGKDVSVAVTTDQILSQPTVDLGISLPTSVMSGLPITGKMTIANTGTVLFPVEPISVTAQVLQPKQQFLNSQPIPPYGHVTQTFSFARTPFLTNFHDTITITLDGKTVTGKVNIVPFTRQNLVIGGLLLALLSTIIWLIAARPWRL